MATVIAAIIALIGTGAGAWIGAANTRRTARETAQANAREERTTASDQARWNLYVEVATFYMDVERCIRETGTVPALAPPQLLARVRLVATEPVKVAVLKAHTEHRSLRSKWTGEATDPAGKPFDPSELETDAERQAHFAPIKEAVDSLFTVLSANRPATVA